MADEADQGAGGGIGSLWVDDTTGGPLVTEEGANICHHLME